MNISKSNFVSSSQEILNSINEADFISFDTEFTGLSTGLFRIHQYESIEDRYYKIKQHIEQFWVCQLGISTFKQKESSSEYEAKVFNMYMYPTHRTLNMSMSSMSFLVENGFNMNFLFKEAIPCVKSTDPSWNTSTSRLGSFSISEKNRLYVERVENEVVEFLKSSQKTMQVPLEGEYQKKLLLGSDGIAPRFRYLEMKCDKKTPLALTVKKNNKKIPEYFPKNRPKKEEEEGKEEEGKEEEKEKEESKANTQVPTMATIVQELLSKKVPLIGHYMILDVAFLYDHFIGPLPPTLEEFRQSVNSIFPPLYDTKYISKSLLSNVKFIKKTSVEDLFSYCKKRKEFSQLVSITPHENFNLSTQAHEAGYDAYMTGYIFINFLKFLPNPEDMQKAAGKICVQGHYKEYIDIYNPNTDDFNFENVVKIKLLNKVTAQELSLRLSRFSDVFVIQEDEYSFFAEFYQVDCEKIDEILGGLNGEEGVRAARFIQRNLI